MSEEVYFIIIFDGFICITVWLSLTFLRGISFQKGDDVVAVLRPPGRIQQVLALPYYLIT